MRKSPGVKECVGTKFQKVMSYWQERRATQLCSDLAEHQEKQDSTIQRGKLTKALLLLLLFSLQVLSDSLRPHEPQHARPPYPSPIARFYPNWCPLCRWCHPTTSSSSIPFSSLLQSSPASGSFQMSQHFTSDGQSVGLSVSTSVLPMDIQNWFPLRWTGLISLLSKGFSRVFSNTTVQKHQFFSTQLSHIHTWLLEKQ